MDKMRCQVCRADDAYLRKDRGRIVCEKCFALMKNSGPGAGEGCVEAKP